MNEYQENEESIELNRIAVYHAVCNDIGLSLPYHDFMVLYDQFIASDLFRLMVEINATEATIKLKERCRIARNSNGILNGNT